MDYMDFIEHHKTCPKNDSMVTCPITGTRMIYLEFSEYFKQVADFCAHTDFNIDFEFLKDHADLSRSPHPLSIHISFGDPILFIVVLAFRFDSDGKNMTLAGKFFQIHKQLTSTSGYTTHAHIDISCKLSSVVMGETIYSQSQNRFLATRVENLPLVSDANHLQGGFIELYDFPVDNGTIKPNGLLRINIYSTSR